MGWTPQGLAGEEAGIAGPAAAGTTEDGPILDGSRSPLRRRAFTATSRLEPDMEMAAISGRNVTPSGSKIPAAIGKAMPL